MLKIVVLELTITSSVLPIFEKICVALIRSIWSINWNIIINLLLFELSIEMCSFCLWTIYIETSRIISIISWNFVVFWILTEKIHVVLYHLKINPCSVLSIGKLICVVLENPCIISSVWSLKNVCCSDVVFPYRRGVFTRPRLCRDTVSEFTFRQLLSRTGRLNDLQNSTSEVFFFCFSLTVHW